MLERRTDYILDRTVLVSSHRADRPHEFEQRNERTESAECVFCPGNEQNTPDDIGRITDENGNWQVRWFPNEFPVVSPDQTERGSRDPNTFLSNDPSYGYHEIIVETPDHNRQMADLSTDELETVFSVYCNRIFELHDRPDVNAVTVFKNHGPDAGTSIIHSHSQVIATSFVPRILQAERNAVNEYDACPYCQVISSERNCDRFCFENDDFLAFTPYASRHDYELWIFPRTHAPALDPDTLDRLVPLVKRAISKLTERDASYNFALHCAPGDDPFHAHIELYPRIGSWGGFERGTGTMINTVPPEQAAAFYRGETK